MKINRLLKIIGSYQEQLKLLPKKLLRIDPRKYSFRTNHSPTISITVRTLSNQKKAISKEYRWQTLLHSEDRFSNLETIQNPLRTFSLLRRVRQKIIVCFCISLKAKGSPCFLVKSPTKRSLINWGLLLELKEAKRERFVVRRRKNKTLRLLLGSFLKKIKKILI